MTKRSVVSRLASDHAQRPFTSFARWISTAVGHPMSFAMALMLIVVWLMTGPLFSFNASWQLVINTTTTIVTFLMVFLIQNSQNRDSAAMQIKLDELIRVDKDAHDALLDLEELTEKELNALRSKYEELAAKAREDLRNGKSDTGIRDI